MQRTEQLTRSEPQSVSTSDFLPFSAPCFDQSERESLLEVLDSGWITTGPRTKQFEDAFAHYVGTEFAVAVNSCTAALHLALAAMDIGESDAVITTPFTFAATANVIVQQRAYPAFVDIDPETFNLDPARLRQFVETECEYDGRELRIRRNGYRVRAIIPVHYGGFPCDMDAILNIAERYGLAVIEDAAHAAGATYKGRKIGALSHATCFSFYANKNMTTAEGGMLTTHDPELARRVRLLSLHGITKDSWARYGAHNAWRYDVIDLGFKYNLSDLASAIGLHQLRKLDSFIERRAELAQLYTTALAHARSIRTPAVSCENKSAWHLYPILVDSSTISRDHLIERLKQLKIGTSVHFIPLHSMTLYQKMFGYRAGDFPAAESAFKRILSLPLFPSMKNSDIARVTDAIVRILGETQLAMAS